MASDKAAPGTPLLSRTRRKSLILVVDDTPDNREMYMEYFEYRGFAVAGAVDGASALEAARKLHPIAILMDLSLPGTDGWEATRVLKSDPLTRDIVIVAVTGHAEPGHRKRAELAGCDLFVTKPSLPEDLLAQVLALIGSRSEAAVGDE